MDKKISTINLDELESFIPDSLTKEKLEKVLRSMKLITTDLDAELAHGDIVFDSKNSEFGVVLSKKPLNIEEFNKVSSAPYVLLTLSRDGDEGDYIFRVRYTHPKNIRRLESSDIIPGKGEKEITKDMRKFCKDFCIMDCGEDCALYKYTRKNGKKN